MSEKTQVKDQLPGEVQGQQVEKVDHGARAKRLLSEASGFASGGNPRKAMRLTAEAQVHAQLHSADQLERLGDRLEYAINVRRNS
jgi:hypothetical protein